MKTNNTGKRVNFISIQHSSGTFANGYQVSPLRTGGEQVISHRTDDMFAATARMDGTVVNVTDRAILVEYKDGSSQSIQIGRRFGTISGAMLPHQIVANVKAGQKVSEGDCIAYNSHYFALDPISPKQVNLKLGVLAKTMIMDNSDTLEDSSAISATLAEKLGTQITYVRDIVLTFDQSIHALVSKGQTVASDDALCIIEDAVTAQNQLFDEDSLDTLRLISANTPRAKHKGLVERIEVFYNGEMESMSPSLQEAAAESNRERKRLARDTNQHYISGQVDEGMRIDGNPLMFQHAVIRVYITSQVGCESGDKFVFGNQLKTIMRRVLDGTHETESGTPIDAIFSYASINNRIVDSPQIMGTTNTLLKMISKKMYDAYKGVQ